MKTLCSERNSGVNPKTELLIIRVPYMTASEFFNDPIFEEPELEID